MTRAIAGLLQRHYGLTPTRITPLPLDQHPVNSRAECGDQIVFVKHHPPHTDPTAERDAIDLSEVAGQHGVPVAGVVRTLDGQVLVAEATATVSVWQWMPGEVITAAFTGDRARTTGAVLGQIHAALADHPATTAPAATLGAWQTGNPAPQRAIIDQILERIDACAAAGLAVPFDTEARRTLIERRTMLHRLPELVAALPAGLTTQVLHGCYSPRHLLFDDNQLTAVVNFRPPAPSLVADELGRAAFHPTTLAAGGPWLAAARTVLTAYLATNPTITAADVRACARVALLRLLASLHGIQQHYLKPTRYQTDLDACWLRHHHAVGLLVEHLDDIDHLLQDLT